jgi:hypothetical protein
VKQKNTGLFIRGGPYETFKIYSKLTFQDIALITKLDLMLLGYIYNDWIIPLIEPMEVIKKSEGDGLFI